MFAANSKFLVADVKHGKNNEAPHRLHITTSSEELRRAVIVSRTRFCKLDSNSYQLAFEYFFNSIGDGGVDFIEYIENLEAVLVDYSTAQDQGSLSQIPRNGSHIIC